MTKRLFVAAMAAAALAVPASASAATIQPGSSIESQGSFCTLNWIFDGAGGPYAGTAAHCVSGVGAVVNLASGSLGSTVERIGTVALRGDPDTPGRDYALVRIDPERAGELNPALAGHPDIPTGVSHNYAKGDLMQFSGHGVGFDASAPTQQQRVADRGHCRRGRLQPGLRTPGCRRPRSERHAEDRPLGAAPDVLAAAERTADPLSD